MASIYQPRVCLRNFTCTDDGSPKLAKNCHFHEAFEDGTLPYLEIVAVGLAIEKFQSLTFGLGFDLINIYLKNLSEYMIGRLQDLKHFNQANLVEIYRKQLNGSILNEYGPLVAFNLKNHKGQDIVILFETLLTIIK